MGADELLTQNKPATWHGAAEEKGEKIKSGKTEKSSAGGRRERENA